MATYRLRSKIFSDEERKGMSTGAKIGLGALATGAALFGARKGMFGSGIRASVNKGYMGLGKALGSKSMVSSGARDYGIARANQFNSSLKTKLSDTAFKRKAVQYQNQAMKVFNPK